MSILNLVVSCYISLDFICLFCFVFFFIVGRKEFVGLEHIPHSMAIQTLRRINAKVERNKNASSRVVVIS